METKPRRPFSSQSPHAPYPSPILSPTGGSCGTCGEGLFCLGESIATEEDDEPTPTSKCMRFDACDNANPVCEGGCGSNEFCASDCQCYASLEELPDFIPIVEHLREEMFLEEVEFPASSCALLEGCVEAPGVRRLLRFTSSALNQGRADFTPPEPKTRPDLFEWGTCHGHYHYKDFASYRLLDAEGEVVKIRGRKAAYCMEDTVR